MMLVLLPLMAFGQVNWITPTQVQALPMEGPAWEQINDLLELLSKWGCQP